MNDLNQLANDYGITENLNNGQVTYVDIEDTNDILFEIDGNSETFHYYLIDGVYIPSVTWILSEAGPVGQGLRYFWQNKTKEEADKILSESAEFGTRMHHAAEDFLCDVELDLKNEYTDSRSRHTLASLARFYNDYTPEDFSLELTVAHNKEINGQLVKFGGKVDFVGTLTDPKSGKKHKWLLDYKTSSQIHYSHELQVVAYRAALLESWGIDVDKVGVLRLGADSQKGYQLKEVDTPRKKRPFQSFLNVYNTFVDMNDGKIPEPKIKMYPAKLKKGAIL